MCIVRNNLLTIPGYTPYCGADICPKHWPRTSFNVDLGQFACSCGYTTDFEKEFIERYRKFRLDSTICKKCKVTVKDNKSKYRGDGSDKDNPHVWIIPRYE